MTIVQLAIIVSVIVVIIVVLSLMLLRKKPSATNTGDNTDKVLSEAAEKGVKEIFNNDFREELRNRGRLHFEKIIGENAMFLQQDLRLTTTQLNDYMNSEIKRVLKDEFAKYEQSIESAKDLALNSIQKTQAVIEQQREVLERQMNDQAATEKARLLEHFENNMADIVNHYLLAAIGSEIDLTAQLDYIFQNLEENKKAIIEDVRSGT